MKIGVIGLGKVGANMVYSLYRAGETPAGIYSRDHEKAGRILKKLRILTKTDLYETVAASDTVLIAVSDNAVSDVAHDVAGMFDVTDTDEDMPLSGKTFMHMSGSLPSTLLQPLKDLGASVGSMHPIQTFNTDMEVPDIFRGICFGVEGDKDAVSKAEYIADMFESAVSEIDTEGKPYYHMACCFASNYLCVLLDIVGRLLNKAGFNEYFGSEALGPLIEQTVINVFETYSGDALTGPIARGDDKTVRKHIEALNAYPRSLADIKGAYQLLGLYALGMGFDNGNFDQSVYYKLYDAIMETDNDTE